MTLKRPKKIHFIGLGDRGTVDLAFELKRAGHSLSGSFGDISGSEKDKLLKHNIISEGAASEKIPDGVDAVIVGSATTKDNPEVLHAQASRISVTSVPEFIFESSRDKQRLVVTGNHGKTLITALIIHVLHFNNRKFDYYAAAPPSGFDGIVKLSDAPVIVIEGQDVSASSFDPSPSFLKYHQHIGVINGIEWQASSQYPTRDMYVRQFQQFGAAMPKGGVLVYFEMDPVVTALPIMDKPDVVFVAYKTHPSVIENGREFLLTPEKQKVATRISGKHNMQNISAAQETLKRIGVTNEMFYKAVPSFDSPVH